MKKLILALSILIISATVDAQTEIKSSANIYINFAEDIMDANNANEKSVDEAILNLEKAIAIDSTYAEAYYLLGNSIFIKIEYITWNIKAIERRGENNSKLKIELRQFCRKAKWALTKSILLGEEDEDTKEMIRILNFELIGDRVQRKKIGVKKIL